MIEQRRVAEALFAARERAEVTLDSIGDAVLSTDLDGNVTYLNLAAEAMPGTLPWSVAILALGSIPVVVLLVVFRGAPPNTIAQVLYDTDQTASGLARVRLFEDSAKPARSDDDAIF